MLYNEIVSLYEILSGTGRRLEKIYHLSELIRKAEVSELKDLMLLCQGKIFAPWDDRKIGVASRIAVKAISKATGLSEAQVESEWKKRGDLGDVAQALTSRQRQSTLFKRELETSDVISGLRSLSSLEGKGSVDTKLSIISELIVSSSPLEAKYIIRTVLDNLRVGTGSGSIREAMVWAFFSESLGLRYISGKNEVELSDDNKKEHNRVSELVQHAYDICSDFGEIAVLLKKEGLEGLKKIKIESGKPINVMLYQKAENISDAFECVGKPAAFEFKYDGFRMAIHINETGTRIFTRRLEEVTEQFPDVLESLKGRVAASQCILEGEAVGLDRSGNYVPFQKISERIRRKYDIKEVAEKFPVELNLFDIIFYEGKSMIDAPFRERRSILEKIIRQKKGKVALSRQIITSDEQEARRFYEESLASGQEGIMAKSLDASYKPGARVGYGVKIKPIMEPLDLVIVGAEYGEGKRSGWFSSFILACLDEGEFKEIGRVSTGFKEIESSDGTSFLTLSNLLEPLIIKADGKSAQVRPEIVIEVGYEEIQKSQSYSSGYALRFPRFLRLRTDEKTTDSINTLGDVRRLYEKQRGRNNGQMRDM